VIAAVTETETGVVGIGTGIGMIVNYFLLSPLWCSITP